MKDKSKNCKGLVLEDQYPSVLNKKKRSFLFIQMKFTLILLLMMQNICYTQNLVPNSSFETYDTCPYATSQITFADQWFNANTGTSDYFNMCIPSSTLITNMGVPDNFLGHQNAFNGNAYAGILLYEWYSPSPSHYREYLQIQLSSPLISFQTYFVSFLVSCADSSMYATDDFGIYFSDTSVTQGDFMNLNFTPQISNLGGNIISDTMGWTLVKGSFVANGGENYMIVGNFKDDYLTDTLKIREGNLYVNGAYYYFDSFCLSTDSTYCNTLNSINDIRNDLEIISIFPNPASNELFISCLESKLCTIWLTDIFGKEIIHNEYLELGESTINTTNLQNGIYIATIQLKDQSFLYKRKIIISK